MEMKQRIDLEELLVKKLLGRFGLLQSLEEKEQLALRALEDILKEHPAQPYMTELSRQDLKLRFIQEFLSYGRLTNLLYDQNVEDIIINSLRPIFIHHSQKGFIPTEVRFQSARELDVYLDKMILFSGHTGRRKIMDIELPNLGGRVNIAFSPFGPQITISKAKVEPLSIIDLIRRGSLSHEAAAQLWMYVEGMSVRPANILIAGGPGTGKTTLLNAMFSFIPIKDRIVLIEDTLELNTFLEDGCSRLETDEDLSLADLVKNSLRMRPERIIVGEVRGEEARDMVTAVNVGKYCMGTIHALTAREAIIRLQNEPMNIPETLVNLFDVFVIMKRYHIGGKLFRVVDEISETGGMEQKKVLLGQIFKYSYEENKVKTVTPSTVYRDKLASEGGCTPRDVINELLIRSLIMKTLDDAGAHTLKEVTTFCRHYAQNPHQAMNNIGLDRTKLIERMGKL